MTDLTWRSQHQGSTVHWPLSGYQIVKAHVKGGVWWHNRTFGLQQHNSEKIVLIRKGLSHKSLLQVESSIGTEWVEFVNKCWESKIFLRNVWNLDKSYFKTEPLTLYLLKLKSRFSNYPIKLVTLIIIFTETWNKKYLQKEVKLSGSSFFLTKYRTLLPSTH